MDNNVAIPIWEKYSLTVNEASAYFNIGPKRIYELIKKDEDADFIIKVGSHYRIKRKNFEAYLETHMVF